MRQMLLVALFSSSATYNKSCVVPCLVVVVAFFSLSLSSSAASLCIAVILPYCLAYCVEMLLSGLLRDDLMLWTDL